MNGKQIILIGLTTVVLPTQEPARNPAQLGQRSVAQGSACEGTLRLIDLWQEGILDLKARYWAGRVRGGTSLSDCDPASVMTDPGLRRDFRLRLSFWAGQKSIPELTPFEVQTFVTQDSRSFTLYNRCGRKEAL
ncbi:MAG: hypothetical protein AAB320_03930 [Elusimicrobiota bacterium]